MKPIMRDIAREQAELVMVESIRYMKEVIYLVWMIFSLSTCSGIAVENPVEERQSRMRQHLNVLGLSQMAYWAGNFCFDLVCFFIQASLMVGLVFPLNLKAFQKEVYSMACLMIAFGPAHILFSYFISFAFNRPQTALKFISVAYMVAGFVFPFIMKVLSVGVDRCEGYFYTVSQALTQLIPL